MAWRLRPLRTSARKAAAFARELASDPEDAELFAAGATEAVALLRFRNKVRPPAEWKHDLCCSAVAHGMRQQQCRPLLFMHGVLSPMGWLGDILRFCMWGIFC